MKCLKTTTVVDLIVQLKTRVRSYPGFAIAVLRIREAGTRAAVRLVMQQLVLTADQVAFIDESSDDTATTTAQPLDEDALMLMPMTDAKRLAAAEFERRYLVCLMERAGTVSEGARLAGLDRTNFRRALQRHGLRTKEAGQ